jgi:hypothetical protein
VCHGASCMLDTAAAQHACWREPQRSTSGSNTRREFCSFLHAQCVHDTGGCSLTTAQWGHCSTCVHSVGREKWQSSSGCAPTCVFKDKHVAGHGGCWSLARFSAILRMRIICCVPLDGSCTARLGCNSIGYVDSCGMSTPMHAAAAVRHSAGGYTSHSGCVHINGVRVLRG